LRFCCLLKARSALSACSPVKTSRAHICLAGSGVAGVATSSLFRAKGLRAHGNVAKEPTEKRIIVAPRNYPRLTTTGKHPVSACPSFVDPESIELSSRITVIPNGCYTSRINVPRANIHVTSDMYSFLRFPCMSGTSTSKRPLPPVKKGNRLSCGTSCGPTFFVKRLTLNV
jgi:hypothetical protein